MATPWRRRALASSPAARLSDADELSDAVRGFFRVPSAQSQKRARPQRQEEAREERERREGVAAAQLKRVKQILRAAEGDRQLELVRQVLDAVMAQLSGKKVASEALERAITMCRELFQRSAAFRRLVAAQTSLLYDRLLSAAGAVGDGKRPSPRMLKTPQVKAVLALIEQWKDDFGDRYLPLVAGYDVLVARGYSFPKTKETQAAEANRQQQLESHQKRVQELKAAQRRREMEEFVPEMEALLGEMHQIFDILIPTLDAFQLPDASPTPPPSAERETDALTTEATAVPQSEGFEDVGATNESDEDDEEDIEWENVESEQDHNGETQPNEFQPHEGMDINEIVQAYGLGSASYQLTIEIPTSACDRSSENEVLFKSLADAILRLRKRFLPLVSDWLAHATKDNREEHARLHDLRARLQDAELKWEDLVRESERKQFARIVPSVVTVPLDAYAPQLPPDPRKRRK